MYLPTKPIACVSAGLAVALGATASMAADAGGALGSMFRPQAGAEAPAATASPAAEAEGSGGVRVVLVGGGRRVATIDGRIVHVGDRINGLRVVRITLQEVVLAADDGTTERLFVNPAVTQSKRAPAGTREVKDPRP